MTRLHTVEAMVAEAAIVALCTVVSIVAIGRDAYRRNAEDARRLLRRRVT